MQSSLLEHEELNELTDVSKVYELIITEDDRIDDIPDIEEWISMESLKLNNAHHVEDLTFTTKFKKLKSLEIIPCNENTDLSPVFELTRLEWLALENPSPQDIKAFSRLINLEYLELIKSPIKTIEKNDLTELSKLRVLIMIDGKLENIDGITCLPKLSELSVYNNKIKNTDKLVPFLKKLKRCELEGNPCRKPKPFQS